MVDSDALGGVSPKLRDRVNDVVRAAAAATTQFTSCEEGMHGNVSVRELTRIASNPEDAQLAETEEKERAEMWSKATAQRKKFVQLLACKPMT